ncbi:MAG: type II secretion system F family protein, partial [Hyphomicrobium sp.]
AAGSLGNTALRDAALGAREGLKDGGTLSVQMRASGRFPELSLRLIAAGEQTGQLDTMLSRVADIFDRSLERDTQRITNLLTPILTVVIGLVVGGLVVSVMGALAGINDLAIR